MCNCFFKLCQTTLFLMENVHEWTTPMCGCHLLQVQFAHLEWSSTTQSVDARTTSLVIFISPSWLHLLLWTSIAAPCGYVASVVHANCKVERWKFRRMCYAGKAAAIGPQNSGCVHTGLLDKTKELHDGWCTKSEESSLWRRQSQWGGESSDVQMKNPINRGF